MNPIHLRQEKSYNDLPKIPVINKMYIVPSARLTRYSSLILIIIFENKNEKHLEIYSANSRVMKSLTILTTNLWFSNQMNYTVFT